MYTRDEKKAINSWSITSGLTTASQLVDSTGIQPSSHYNDYTGQDIPLQQFIIPQNNTQQKNISEMIEEAMNESNLENERALRKLANL
ncbi:MAG: hypothetical protein ACFFB5_20915 [Promethearchaeota archaeon]